MNKEIPRKEYPRPQFVRKDWTNLNGLWDFSFDDGNVGESEKWYQSPELDREIMVPFTFESEASQIGDKQHHPYIWYHREFAIDKKYKGKKIILNFAAVDYLTRVWVNGEYVGQHQGGYSSFALDITEQVEFDQPNSLVVKVEDSLSCYQPRGKQSWKDDNFGCWYNRTTGIWQTVWLEYLDEIHFSRVKMTPDIDNNAVSFEYYFSQNLADLNLDVKTSIYFQGQKVKEFNFKPADFSEKVKIRFLKDFHHDRILWTPDDPNLFDVIFELYQDDKVLDKVESYFGMRKISIKDGQVLLNNRPIYQRLILDQGYWPETLLTPPSDEAIKKDIQLTKKMGFNGARKHQKVEDARYYYWCDKMGLLVWSEMAATYEFSDTAVTNFTKEWLDIVQEHYNHPSIITWTPFNESWGVANILHNQAQQHFTESIYYLTKSLDPYRPVIVNDGWEHTISDIISLHDYVEKGSEFKARYSEKDKIMNNEIPHNLNKYAFAEGYRYQGQPIQISEFGGIAFTSKEGWGYGNQVQNEAEFLQRLENIVEAVREFDYISGYCYTQLSDVQQEVNGLVTFDRQPKIDPTKLKEIFGE